MTWFLTWTTVLASSYPGSPTRAVNSAVPRLFPVTTKGSSKEPTRIVTTDGTPITGLSLVSSTSKLLSRGESMLTVADAGKPCSTPAAGQVDKCKSFTRPVRADPR